jgi:glycosyltransferase involved in cell wall biosynthesis
VLRADIQRYYPRLDALAVLTETDRRDYVALFRSGAPRVVLLPNAVPALDGGRADPTRKTVVAAGRLTRQKGFDRLIPAWSQVARAHPDWRLEIYGSGPEGRALQQLVSQHGLSGTVRLMGRTKRLGHAFSNASIFVLSSRREGLPMVILEAMSKGLPVVSFDCPTGPAEIVVDDYNGVLVPDGDIPALTRALRRLVEDDEQRARLGSGALETAARYDVEAIGKQWAELIDGLLRVPSTPESASGK